MLQWIIVNYFLLKVKSDFNYIMGRSNFCDITCSTLWPTSSSPSNNFAENPRKFPGIFHRKIRWERRQFFPGISRNPFRGTRSEEFIVTHSEEILVTLSKEFLVANSLGNFLLPILQKNQRKFVAKRPSEPIPGNFPGTIPKSSSGISWNIH